MPGHNGTGPCGGGMGFGARRGGFGRGAGGAWGPGFGRGAGGGAWGRGRGFGWASVGYAPGGESAAALSMRDALEERRSFLRAELARTEALLAEAPAGGEPEASGRKDS